MKLTTTALVLFGCIALAACAVNRVARQAPSCKSCRDYCQCMKKIKPPPKSQEPKLKVPPGANMQNVHRAVMDCEKNEEALWAKFDSCVGYKDSDMNPCSREANCNSAIMRWFNDENSQRKKRSTAFGKSTAQRRKKRQADGGQDDAFDMCLAGKNLNEADIDKYFDFEDSNFESQVDLIDQVESKVYEAADECEINYCDDQNTGGNSRIDAREAEIEKKEQQCAKTYKLSLDDSEENED